MDYLVISDLHIGGNTDLDIFHSQPPLASFLKSFDDRARTLIINGDFIDFLAVQPLGSFNRKAAQEKIKQIIDAAPNEEVWAAFRAFLGVNQKNRIEILLGNHDIELVFDEVQEALRAVMADSNEGERIHFIIDRLSHPRLVVGGVHIHVEHGFQYDTFNWYDHNKLIQSTQYNQDGAKFVLPIGSRLVYAVLNTLTPNHRFIPLLKPEAAVFWMMVALAPKQVFKNLGAAAIIGKSTFTASLRKYLKGIQLGESATPVPTQSGTLAALQAQLADMLVDEKLTDESVNDIEEFLTYGTGSERAAPGLTFAGSPVLRGKLFLVRRALKTLKDDRDSFFDTARRDDFQSALDAILAANAKVAILGHSHGRKILTLFKEGDLLSDPLYLKRPSLLYLNTGTWADLLDFDLKVLSDDEAAEQWLDALEAGTFQPKLVYTFARLEELPGGRGVRVSLEEWRDNHAHTVEAPREVLP